MFLSELLYNNRYILWESLLMNFSTKTTTRKKSSISTKPVDISFR